MDKHSSEYSIGDVIEDRENIVPLDDERAAINSLQIYLSRQKKKFNLAQAGNQNKRLTFLKNVISKVKRQLIVNSPIYDEAEDILTIIEKSFTIIKDSNNQELFSKNIAQVAQSISVVEQKTLPFLQLILNELKVDVNKTSEELKQHRSLIFNLQNEVSKKDEKIFLLKDKLKNSEGTFKKTSQDFAELNNQLDTQRKGNISLIQELEENKNIIKNLTNQGDTFLIERKKFETKLEEIQKILDEKTEALEKSISETSTLEISLEAIKQQYHTKRYKVDELEQAIKKLNNNSENNSENTAQIIYEKSSKEPSSKLEKALKRAEAIASSKANEASTLRAEFENLFSLFKEKEKECDNLKEDNLKKQTKIEKTFKSFDDHGQQLIMAKRGLNEANNKIETLDNEIGTKEIRLQNLKKENVLLVKRLKYQEKKAKESFITSLTLIFLVTTLLLVIKLFR